MIRLIHAIVADIVVTTPDSPDVLLVVEVTVNTEALMDIESQLKTYMAHTSCPAGMLVTRETERFYRNRYTHHDHETVERLGECPTVELLGGLQTRLPIAESYLEERVEQWLDSLRQSGNQTWPSTVQEAIEACLLPAVLGGVIRAGGPRWRKTGS
jgi:hypothetical protein